MKVTIRIFQGVFTALLALVVLCNGWMLFSQAVLKEDPPSLFGYSQLIVTSGSMEPTFDAGDLIWIHKERESKPGDVVTFRDNENQLVTHRIVGTSEGKYITQGDANNSPDSQLLEPANVVGVYVAAIPKIGEALLFLRTPVGLGLLIIVGFLLIELPNWLTKDRGGKGGKHGEKNSEV